MASERKMLQQMQRLQRIQSRSQRARRAGRVRLWIPLALFAAIAIWAIQNLGSNVAAAEYTLVDPHRSRLVSPPGNFVDPRWQSELALAMAELPPCPAEDQAGLERARQRLSQLCCVAEAGLPRVVWPNGFQIPVRLREPVACLRSGALFLCVASDGIVLPGAWSEPPLVEGKRLAVIGPNDGVLDTLAPGRALHEPRHLDALSVAVSMRAHLSAEDFEALGPLLIDASRARVASVSEPGVRLLLENQRAVLFGRAPWTSAPGELPVALKWKSIAKGAALLRGLAEHPEWNWAVLDARWDTPELRTRADPAFDTRSSALR